MERNRRPGWLILLLALIGGGAAWAWRYLRDDDSWTQVPAGEPWEPSPSPAPAAFAAPKPTPEPAPVAEPAPVHEPAPVPTPPPGVVPASAADDLTRVEGIGPKISVALHHAGLTTYAAVAGASDETLREALSAASMRFAPSLPTWARQARLLADGDEAGFAELTDRLKGGREVS